MIKDYTDVKIGDQREEYEAQYREILAHYPILAYVSAQKAPSKQEPLDQVIRESLISMKKEIKEDLKGINLNDRDDARKLFTYPSFIKKFLQQSSPLSLTRCMAVESLHKKNGPNNFKAMAKNIGVGLASMAGGAACLFSGGAVCALGVAVLSEGYFLGVGQLEYSASQSLFNAQLIHPDEMEQKKGLRDTSAVLAPLSFVGLHGAQGLSLSRKTLARTRPGKSVDKVLALKEELIHYSPTLAHQNSAWIHSARSQKAKLYMDVENAAIKRLNDQMGDKNLVTALTNLHKKILNEKLEKLFAKYPDLDVKRYSDFKSVRFAFSGKLPSNLEEKLNEVLLDTARKFDSQASLGLVGKQSYEEMPSRWFNAGLGESADQAGIAARQMRKLKTKRKSPSRGVSFKDVKVELKKALVESEARRINAVNIIKKYESQAVDLLDEGTPRLFSERFFEVMRKNADSEIDGIKTAFKRNFNVTLLDKEVRRLKNYFHKVDDFSPGVWVDKRTLANLDEAGQGGFSADFKGMGAKNLQQVARDLAENPNDLDQALLAIREGEKKVTETFNKGKQSYQQTVEKTLSRFNIKVDQACSGDDCVSLVQSPLSREMEEEIVSSFARSDENLNLRLSFIPPNVESRYRSELAVHGELIEKKTRSLITGFGDEQLSPSVLEKLNFAIKMPTQLNEGNVRLIIGQASDFKLSSEARKIIQKNFSLAVRQVNKELEQDVGGVFKYMSP